MHLTIKEMEHDILHANRHEAEHNREKLKAKAIKSFELMGAIGSGKTKLIEEVASRLIKNGLKIGFVAGDVAGDDDYRRLTALGLKGYNVNTGKECHLDARIIKDKIENLTKMDINILFIENVGNLVCPTDFPLGAERRILVISTTEGDDIARKHPAIFSEADAVVVNKIDLAEHVDVNIDTILKDIKNLNPDVPVFLTDLKHGKGVELLTSWIMKQ
ncbi:MAG TPA: hydrogenase nickel incorporation protein HypB [Thermoplasmata archaeon]|nr:hydrogenase nickel incorporation protein HypB [Thermoplasmata archaeon]